jgi:hypothetical protein
MRHLRLIAVLALAAGLTVPAAASAAANPTRVSAPSTASWESQQQINIEVTLSCEEGVFYSISVGVLQQQGPFMQVFGNGFTNGTCTGRHQRVALAVFASSFPGWQLGDAIARVDACAFTCDAASRSIRIAL